MTTLSTVRPGSQVRVLKLEAEEALCHRLREMGFAENAVVHCVQSGAACICRIQHARVGLSSRLASRIYVEPLR